MENKEKILLDEENITGYKGSKVAYLGINLIWRELKSLSWKWKLLIVLMAIVFTLDTLILDYGTSANSHFTWLWETSYKEQSWHGWTKGFYDYWYASKITNGITAFVGVLNVILISNRKITNYFWGIISCVFYGNYAFAAGYTGDAILNLFFYLPMSFIGFSIWRKHMNDSVSDVKVNIFKWWFWGILTTFVAVTTVAWFYLIPFVDEQLRIALFNDHAGYYFAGEFWAHFFDAFTNALGVASTFLMYGRFGQEFMLYIVKDLIGIIMWSGIFHTGIIGFDLSMVISASAYLLAGAGGLWVWMHASKSGIKVVNMLEKPFGKKSELVK